jgi:hypothetical protein
MPSSGFTAKFDRRQEKEMLKGYSPEAVTNILQEAAKHGATEGAKVLRAEAPIGVAERLSQYYRRKGLAHGTFRKSVRAAMIRGRRALVTGLQGKTVGYVMGPLGPNAFTRGWIEAGTTHSRANPWVARTSDAAFSVARQGSEAVLELYVREH